MTTAGAADN